MGKAQKYWSFEEMERYYDQMKAEIEQFTQKIMTEEEKRMKEIEEQSWELRRYKPNSYKF